MFNSNTDDVIRLALIPAAGRGARLDRPGTPKPLVDIGGKPMILRLIEQLQEAGIKKVVVVTGYNFRKVTAKLRSYESLNVEIEIVQNPNWKKGLISSILAAKNTLPDPFVLAMSDHIFADELVRRIVSKPSKQGLVTAMVDVHPEAVFSLDSAVKAKVSNGQIARIDRCLTDYNAVDTGLFRADPVLFEILSRAELEGCDELFQGLRRLAEKGRLEAVSTDGLLWADVDTPADVIHAEMCLRKDERERKVRASVGSSSISKGQSFDFVTGAPFVTKMVVGKGFVQDPGSLPLIPDESASSPIFIFTDDTVNRLYGQNFMSSLRKQGYDIHGIVLPDGEEAKTLANYAYLTERVLSRGVDERSVFISLGGGVVCNVCGFIASTVYRGLDLVHVPTTLMAQCDAAISHKQAINGQRGKNMVGSYYAPRLVAVDVEVLSTLPKRLVRDGLAEVIKHALGQDAGYTDMLLEYKGAIDDRDFLEEVVRRNVELKCNLSASDPKEKREAMVLQYGHTVGHPVEHLSGYRFYHGESIAIGMVVAAKVAYILGACKDSLVELHQRLISTYELPTLVPNCIRTDDMLESLRYNKRYLTEGTRMALLRDVGKLLCIDDNYVIPVSDSVLAEAFESIRSKDMKLPKEHWEE